MYLFNSLQCLCYIINTSYRQTPEAGVETDSRDCILHFTYLLGWSAAEATIIGANYRPIVPALDDRLLWSNRGNELLDGESKIHRDNLPQYRFVHRKFHMTWPGRDLQ
jgi:hypothetical protein